MGSPCVCRVTRSARTSSSWHKDAARATVRHTFVRQAVAHSCDTQGTDTRCPAAYGRPVRSGLRLLLCVVALAAARPALADDGAPTFHRTTPRATFDEGGKVLVIGVPGGRAWGIESELRTLPPAGTTLVVRLAVTDDAVREAFVRIAYYGTAATRTRQLATADSEPVAAHRRTVVAIQLEPPPGAVAFRVRVLARLVGPDGRSADDAVRATLRWARGPVRPVGSLFSRLIE
jgi:hypothetical protein